MRERERESRLTFQLIYAYVHDIFLLPLSNLTILDKQNETRVFKSSVASLAGVDVSSVRSVPALAPSSVLRSLHPFHRLRQSFSHAEGGKEDTRPKASGASIYDVRTEEGGGTLQKQTQ